MTARPLLAGLRDPAAQQAFCRSLIGWTCAFWAVAYVLLTIRSVVGAQGNLGFQAVLRVPMMLIGIGICAALYPLLIRIDELPLRAKIPLAGLAAILGALLFSISVYFVFFVWSHRWQPEPTVIAQLARGMFEFIWIFVAWVALFQFVRNRAVVAPTPPKEQTFVTELWARQLNQQVRIPVDSIERIESEGDYARVHVGDRSFLIRSTMQRLEDSLDPAQMVRVHRRAIVARGTIVAVRRRPDGRLAAQLASGAIVPVGRNYAQRLQRDAAVPEAAPLADD
jgi:hypothetical protein